MKHRSVIYDLGANNGDDIPYYLEKAELVVAVEALPGKAKVLMERFREAINAGRLVVENIAVTEKGGEYQEIPMWVHDDDVKTTVVPPSTNVHEYQETSVRALGVADLIGRHGEPLYIKVDLEHYDAAILRGLFSNGIFPPFISAEGHDPAVFGLLSGMGEYSAFKFVKGRSVSRLFKNFRFRGLDGEILEYSFPWGSAGPFGDDIPGAWFAKESAFSRIRVLGCGWFDIHASFGAGVSEPLDLTLDEFLASSILQVLRPNTLRRLKNLRGIVRKLHRMFSPS